MPDDSQGTGKPQALAGDEAHGEEKAYLRR
jgi:hypothetical protein